MVSFRQFDPSEDVLQAIQSLRDEDGAEAASLETTEAEGTHMADLTSRASAIAGAYRHSIPGIYFRARV